METEIKNVLKKAEKIAKDFGAKAGDILKVIEKDATYGTKAGVLKVEQFALVFGRFLLHGSPAFVRFDAEGEIVLVKNYDCGDLLKSTSYLRGKPSTTRIYNGDYPYFNNRNGPAFIFMDSNGKVINQEFYLNGTRLGLEEFKEVTEVHLSKCVKCGLLYKREN